MLRLWNKCKGYQNVLYRPAVVSTDRCVPTLSWHLAECFAFNFETTTVRQIKFTRPPDGFNMVAGLSGGQMLSLRAAWILPACYDRSGRRHASQRSISIDHAFLLTVICGNLLSTMCFSWLWFSISSTPSSTQGAKCLKPFGVFGRDITQSILDWKISIEILKIFTIENSIETWILNVFFNRNCCLKLENPIEKT